MTTNLRPYLATIVSFVLFPFLATSQTSKPAAWSGVIVYSSCNADEAFNESPECFKNAPGATLALYDDTNRVMFSLDPQEKVAGHLGEVVTIHGTLDEDSIHVTQLATLSVGLAVGQKAPAFSLPDQFGNIQTLESLKGKNGTVLLFFRSADW
jgi:hypothetical protein